MFVLKCIENLIMMLKKYFTVNLLIQTVNFLAVMFGKYFRTYKNCIYVLHIKKL